MTVYAFSTENWNRSEEEVSYLMDILGSVLDKFIAKLDSNVKINFIGSKTERLNPKLAKKMVELEEKTKNNDGLNLMIAFNYGGRDEITHACKLISEEVKEGKLNIDDITEETVANHLYTAGKPDPDLLIRTSGELRTSNFLPWQITYSEFLFLNKYWPDFTEEDIDYCIKEYSNRKRRKGK
jgi:undecaprenyl diphosphate synthase